MNFNEYVEIISLYRQHFGGNAREAVARAIHNDLVGLFSGQQDDSLLAELIKSQRIARAGHDIYMRHPDMPPEEIFRAAVLSLLPIRLVATGDQNGLTAVAAEFEDELAALGEMDATNAQASGRWGR